MIFTYPAHYPDVPANLIPVDSSKPFDLDQAKRILDRSQSRSLVLAYTGLDWWTQPEVGKLFDFLGYRGADLIHVVGKHSMSHSAYLASRLEKLYTDDILDNWAQV